MKTTITLIGLTVLLLSCEGTVGPPGAGGGIDTLYIDRDSRGIVWLYPGDVIAQSGGTIYFDIEYSTFIERRGGQVWVMVYSQDSYLRTWRNFKIQKGRDEATIYYLKFGLIPEYPGQVWDFAYFYWDINPAP